MEYIIHYDILSAIIMFLVIVANNKIETTKSLYNTLYVNMAIVVEICCIADIGSSICLMNPNILSGYTFLTNAFTYVYYFSQMLPSVLMSLYIYAYIHQNKASTKEVLIISIPTIICELIVITNPFTGFAFRITNGIFERGPLVLVLYLVTVLYLFCAAVIMKLEWKNTDSALRLVFFSYIILGLGSLLIQFFFPSLLVECSAMTLLVLITHYSVQNKSMLNEAVKKEREIAEVADRVNRLKSKFVSEISHDIRTPMNAIIGMSNIAREEIENKEQALKCLDQVLSSANYMMAMMNNILEMNELEEDKVVLDLKPVIMENEIKSIISIVKPQFEKKNQTLTLNYNTKESCYVYADVLRLNQILIKIITNASLYMHEGKKATVDVSFTTTENGKVQYTFDIVDEGIGMKPEFVEHMFEPFEKERTTTESGIESYGLGMAIVKKLLDAMNARIDIESVPDKGTRVSIGISFKQGDRIVVNNNSEGNNNDKQLEMKDILSLVVEDNEVNIRILSRALRRSGATVIVARNGEEAVNKVNNLGIDRIGVIFMDLQMPVMDGFEATRCIREIESSQSSGHVPIYAVTANTAQNDCERAFEAGVDGIFAKPVHFDEFFRKLSEDGLLRISK